MSMSIPTLGINVLGILSLFWLNTKALSTKKDCIKLDVSITQKIENLGFHRDLNWLIVTENLDPEEWLNASCNAAIKFDVGQAMFVNPDQVEDLKRLGKLDIIIDGSVDVEAPAHEGSQHTVYIFLKSSQIPHQISVKLPIHLRYQRSLLGGHGKVLLNKPMLLVHCLKTNSIICGKDKKVNAPASSEEFKTFRVWKNISYKANFDEMELLVPIGNLDDYACVAVISCILGCAGCIYILSLMSNVDKEE